jgi:aspartokinase
MINVADKVSRVIRQDEIASEALRGGLLNLSAYADTIHDQIEDLTKKPVKRGTIVVALARLKKKYTKLPSLRPQIQVTNISVKSALRVLTYEKTLEIQRKIAVLHPFLLPMNDLVSVTEGNSEVTVVVAEKSAIVLKKHFDLKPKSEYSHVVAVTVQFSEKFANTTNFVYGLLSTLAAKRINLIEVVSTFTEISFIVNKEDMAETMGAFQAYFIKEPIHES